MALACRVVIAARLIGEPRAASDPRSGPDVGRAFAEVDAQPVAGPQ